MFLVFGQISGQEAEEKIHEVCWKLRSVSVLENQGPNFSLECLIELRSFFQDCESGLNSSCPRALAVESCPGAVAFKKASDFIVRPEALRVAQRNLRLIDQAHLGTSVFKVLIACCSSPRSPWFSTLSLKEFAKFVACRMST